LKAVNSLHIAHELQLVNYLTATGVDNGLLINFGSEELQFKRKYRIYRKQF
jgi:GxxExxY protein